MPTTTSNSSSREYDANSFSSMVSQAYTQYTHLHTEKYVCMYIKIWKERLDKETLIYITLYWSSTTLKSPPPNFEFALFVLSSFFSSEACFKECLHSINQNPWNRLPSYSAYDFSPVVCSNVPTSTVSFIEEVSGRKQNLILWKTANPEDLETL